MPLAFARHIRLRPQKYWRRSRLAGDFLPAWGKVSWKIVANIQWERRFLCFCCLRLFFCSVFFWLEHSGNTFVFIKEAFNLIPKKNPQIISFLILFFGRNFTPKQPFFCFCLSLPSNQKKLLEVLENSLVELWGTGFFPDDPDFINPEVESSGCFLNRQWRRWKSCDDPEIRSQEFDKHTGWDSLTPLLAGFFFLCSRNRILKLLESSKLEHLQGLNSVSASGPLVVRSSQCARLPVGGVRPKNDRVAGFYGWALVFENVQALEAYGWSDLTQQCFGVSSSVEGIGNVVQLGGRHWMND